MKRRVVISLVGIIIITAMGVAYFGNIIGKKPFQKLDSSDVLSASVSVFPPDVIVEIHDEEEIKELVNILKTVVTYGDSWDSCDIERVT